MFYDDVRDGPGNKNILSKSREKEEIFLLLIICINVLFEVAFS